MDKTLKLSKRQIAWLYRIEGQEDLQADDVSKTYDIINLLRDHPDLMKLKISDHSSSGEVAFEFTIDIDEIFRSLEKRRETPVIEAPSAPTSAEDPSSVEPGS